MYLNNMDLRVHVLAIEKAFRLYSLMTLQNDIIIKKILLPQRPMTSDFEGFSIPDFIHYICFPILILEKETVFPFLMFSAKQGNYWYHFITSLV